VAEAGARRGGSRCVLFYRRPREGSSRSKLVPVRCTSTTLMTHIAGDGMVRGVSCEGVSTVGWGQSDA
jgi:hypothetical protein